MLRDAAKKNADIEARQRAEKLISMIESNLYRFVWTVRGDKSRSTRVTLTPDGKQFVATGFHALCRGEIETGKILHIFGQAAQTRTYRCLAISADCSQAFVGADDRVARLFDIKTGRELLEFKGHDAPIQGVGP